MGSIELGQNRPDQQDCYIDLKTSPNSDFSARIIKWGTGNKTGDFELVQQASISNPLRLSANNIQIGNETGNSITTVASNVNSTSATTGAFLINGIGMGNGNIYATNVNASVCTANAASFVSLNSFHDNNTHSTTGIKLGRSDSQYVTFHGGSSGNFLSSVSTSADAKPLILKVNEGTGTNFYTFRISKFDIGSGAVVNILNPQSATNTTTGALRLQGIGLGAGNGYFSGTVVAGGISATTATTNSLTINDGASTILQILGYNAINYPDITEIINASTTGGALLIAPTSANLVVLLKPDQANDRFAIIRTDYSVSSQGIPTTHVLSVDSEGVLKLGANKKNVPSSVATGVSGSFTTVDNKTVTIESGVVVDINLQQVAIKCTTIMNK